MLPLLSCSPYDTLEEVIGLRGTPGIGSLMDFGVTYRKLDLTPAGSIDWEALASAIRPGVAAVGWGGVVLGWVGWQPGDLV